MKAKEKDDKKKSYSYQAPEKVSYESYLKEQVPAYSNLRPEDLEKLVQVYAQTSYYVNGNWET